MCPAHRLEKIAAIRERVRVGAPCLVVSTQRLKRPSCQRKILSLAIRAAGDLHNGIPAS
jgi:hypothetical protein